MSEADVSQVLVWSGRLLRNRTRQAGVYASSLRMEKSVREYGAGKIGFSYKRTMRRTGGKLGWRRELAQPNTAARRDAQEGWELCAIVGNQKLQRNRENLGVFSVRSPLYCS